MWKWAESLKHLLTSAVVGFGQFEEEDEKDGKRKRMGTNEEVHQKNVLDRKFTCGASRSAFLPHEEFGIILERN